MVVRSNKTKYLPSIFATLLIFFILTATFSQNSFVFLFNIHYFHYFLLTFPSSFLYLLWAILDILLIWFIIKLVISLWQQSNWAFWVTIFLGLMSICRIALLIFLVFYFPIIRINYPFLRNLILLLLLIIFTIYLLRKKVRENFIVSTISYLNNKTTIIFLFSQVGISALAIFINSTFFGNQTYSMSLVTTGLLAFILSLIFSLLYQTKQLSLKSLKNRIALSLLQLLIFPAVYNLFFLSSFVVWHIA